MPTARPSGADAHLLPNPYRVDPRPRTHPAPGRVLVVGAAAAVLTQTPAQAGGFDIGFAGADAVFGAAGSSPGLLDVTSGLPAAGDLAFSGAPVTPFTTVAGLTTAADLLPGVAAPPPSAPAPSPAGDLTVTGSADVAKVTLQGGKPTKVEDVDKAAVLLGDTGQQAGVGGVGECAVQSPTGGSPKIGCKAGVVGQVGDPQEFPNLRLEAGGSAAASVEKGVEVGGYVNGKVNVDGDLSVAVKESFPLHGPPTTSIEIEGKPERQQDSLAIGPNLLAAGSTVTSALGDSLRLGGSGEFERSCAAGACAVDGSLSPLSEEEWRKVGTHLGNAAAGTADLARDAASGAYDLVGCGSFECPPGTLPHVSFPAPDTGGAAPPTLVSPFAGTELTDADGTTVTFDGEGRALREYADGSTVELEISQGPAPDPTADDGPVPVEEDLVEDVVEEELAAEDATGTGGALVPGRL